MADLLPLPEMPLRFPRVTWSHSTLKAFEDCAKRYAVERVFKLIPFTQSPAMIEGDEIHKAIQRHLRVGAALPAGIKHLEPVLRALVTGTELTLSELKWGLTPELVPCDFFDQGVGLRVILDLLVVRKDGLIAIDFKTGSPAWADQLQLRLQALAALQRYPEFDRIATAFLFMDSPMIQLVFNRADIPSLVSTLTPRLERFRDATLAAVYPARPGRLCKSCKVVSCPHHPTAPQS